MRHEMRHVKNAREISERAQRNVVEKHKPFLESRITQSHPLRSTPQSHSRCCQSSLHEIDTMPATKRVINFAAGPAKLPRSVLEQVSAGRVCVCLGVRAFSMCSLGCCARCFCLRMSAQAISVD